VFTPKLLVKDKNNQDIPVQEFLQNTFLDMWDMVVRTIGDLEGVVGLQVGNTFGYSWQSLTISQDDERDSSRIYQPSVLTFV
jgi:hypothetical protein